MPSATNNLEFLPWSWTITRDPPHSHDCPSPASILGTFVAVNIITSLLGILMGHRRVIHFLSRGRWGKLMGKGWWTTWPIPVALQLSANTTVAAIVKYTNGYTSTFSIAQLTFFLVARPRLSLIVLLLVSLKRNKYMRGPNGVKSLRRGDDVDYPWYTSSLSQLVAELVLQIMALVIMGHTTAFGSSRGYYTNTSVAYQSLPQGGRIMYAGAMLYLVGGCVILPFQFILLLVVCCIRFPEREHDDERANLFVYEHFIRLAFAIAIIFTTFLGSWLFWAGFVFLVGDLYCIPNLASQGAIWITFSVLGIMFGGVS